jgi:hypothetical protein
MNEERWRAGLAIMSTAFCVIAFAAFFVAACSPKHFPLSPSEAQTNARP